MDRPSIPTTPPGRSALPSFRAWEADLARHLEEALKAAEARVKGAQEEAARIRAEGGEHLKQWVLDAQEQALREAEDKARDRVSTVRARTQRWVEEAEEAARGAVDDALDLCCGS